MPESTDTSTTSTSESDQPTAGAGDAGAGADGSAGGTQATADGTAFAAERERFNATIRQLQSERDRATARIATLEAGTGAGTSSTQESSENPEIAALREAQGQILAELRRSRIEPVAKQLQAADEFSVVAQLRPDLFTNLDGYADVDALRSSLDAAAAELNPLAQAMEERIRAEVLAEVSEKYGLRLAPKTPEGEERHGDPDVASLAGMNVKDLDPEQALRVLRSVS